MAAGQRFLTPSRVNVTILPPHYPPKGQSDRQSIQKLNKQVREAFDSEIRKQKNGKPVTAYSFEVCETAQLHPPVIGYGK